MTKVVSDLLIKGLQKKMRERVIISFRVQSQLRRCEIYSFGSFYLPLKIS